LRDAALYRAKMQFAGRIGWKTYFPYLLSRSRPDRLVLCEERGDALLVYLLTNGGKPKFHLLFPPAPWTDEGLAWAEDRLRSFNGGAAPKVESVEESDALRLVRQGYRIQLRDVEYIYDRAAVVAAEGPNFKSLRQKLSVARRHPDLRLRPYKAADEAECAGLLRDWQARRRERGDSPDGYSYTRRLLRVASDVSDDLMRGEVAEREGRICGFAFGGPIAVNHGSIFVVITDFAVDGLSYLLRQSMMQSFPTLAYFNDSIDSGRVGLRQLKMRFRPADMSPIYRGRAER
jgi:hypothetical protein